MKYDPVLEAALAQERLVKALPGNSPLRRKLTKCGSFGIWSNNEWRCRAPACAKCRWRYTQRQQKEAIRRLSHAHRDDLFLVTVVFGIGSEIEDVGDLWTTFRKALRNRFDARRRQDAMWLGAEFIGWLEADPVRYDDLSILGGHQRELIAGMPSPCWLEERPAWLAHVHAILHAPGISEEDVADVFTSHWSGSRQVHIEPFSPKRPKEDSIRDIVKYATKYSSGRWIRGTWDSWTSSDLTQYHEWASSFSRGWQSLRVRLGTRIKKIASTKDEI